MNHGPHRCEPDAHVTTVPRRGLTCHPTDFFEIVALGETLAKDLLESRPTREEVAEAVQGKVLAWGLWVGAYERKWR